MSTSTATVVENRTSTTPSPWPGRIMRLTLVLLILVAWYAAGRFAGYQIAGRSVDGIPGADRCITSQQVISSEQQLRDKLGVGDNWPTSYLTGVASTWDGSHVTVTQLDNEQQYLVTTTSNDGCTWLDDYNLTSDERILSILAGVFILLAISVVLMVTAWFASVVGDIIWNG